MSRLVSDLLSLTKPRLTALVLLASLAGFHLGGPIAAAASRAAWLLVGTALLAGGAAALNMLIERHHDARMLRTRDRPLPAGRVAPGQALLFGTLLSGLGLLVLALRLNLLTSFVGAVTLTSYLFFYTPLKRLTPLNTLAGALPGALPTVMGWTAARGTLNVEAFVVFTILFIWQIPHFLAIAWLYREDYARGGFSMLPVVDPHGSLTAGQVLNGCLALLVASLLPTLVGLTGPLYFVGALIVGTAFLGFGVSFLVRRTTLCAQRLFLASLVYLPALLLLMLLDRSGA